MTNQQGAQEALTLAGAVDHWARVDYGLRGDEMRKAAAELRRLHYENERLAALVEAQQPARIAAAPQPTPTAQADSVTAPAGGADWQDISTAPKDGTRFVAVGQNYGLDSEAQHTCIAQWLAGCWVEVSDWNGASKLKYLTHWMPLPPLPCSAARTPADSVLEDVARLDWLALAGPTSICLVIDRPHDGEVEVSTDDATGYGKTLREALDAARKQGANHD